MGVVSVAGTEEGKALDVVPVQMGEEDVAMERCAGERGCHR